jgi:hypothetical protein
MGHGRGPPKVADGGGEEVKKLPSQTFHLVEKSCDWSVTKCKKKRVLKLLRQMMKRTFMDMLPMLRK